MRPTADILRAKSLEALRSFANDGDVLLAFDFDGTLAPIVNDPAKARMRARTRDLLARVASEWRCAVISGREADDVARRLEGTNVWDVIGNYGLEPWFASDDIEAIVRDWLPRVELEVLPIRGARVEFKRYAIAIHYRLARDRARALREITRVIERLRGSVLRNVRVIHGKAVVNVLPYSVPGKAVALQRVLRLVGCSRAVYVGDDVSDEEIFALEPESVLGIRVGTSRTSRARFFVRTQEDVDALLAALAAMRAPALARPPVLPAKRARRRSSR